MVVMVLVGEVSEKAEAENSQRNVSSRMASWLAGVSSTIATMAVSTRSGKSRETGKVNATSR